MVRLMLEKEQRYVEALRSQLAARCPPASPLPGGGSPAPSPTASSPPGGPHPHQSSSSTSPAPAPADAKLQTELEGAERRVRELERRVAALTAEAAANAAAAAAAQQQQHEVAVPQQISSLHTHHRTKSSPDPLNMQNLSPSEASKRLIASESMSDLSYGSKRTRSSGGFDMDSPRVTPPGTPPPPYGGSSTTLPSDSGDTLTEEEGGVHDLDDHGKRDTPTSEVSPIRTSLPQYASTTILQQHPIISMEEDDMSDQEVSQLEDHGPFKSLSKLWEHTAHLAVFMNYVICNNDTSSLLFYLVTDLYKEGNAKEMKKWAYEIHSSFLVPGAPLRLNNVDENVAREIDDVLLNESDKEEILRKIFWKARVKAKEELNEQLADFQQKRTAGLGTLFGPPDTELDMSIHDKNVEIKIVEKVLLPNLEHYKEVIERDNTDIRRFTAAAALVTVLSKVFGLRAPHSNSLLDRCPTFVSKDKSLKSRLIGKSRKINVRGHHFVAHQYFSVTYCNHCQLIICGIGPQGYQCSDCSLNIHRHCVRIVEENCPGPLVKKERGNDRISKLMEKIRPEREPRRKPSNHNFSQIERMRKQTEEDSGGLTDGEGGTGDRPASGGRAERRPDPLREEERGGVGGGGSGGGGAGGGGGGGSLDGSRAAPDDDAHDPQHAHHHHDLPHHHPPTKPSAASINRSESYKERSYKERVQKRPLRERRKTSDPNLSSKTNDVDLENTQGLSYNTNSGSSSNSSLSTRSLDSPSNSVEVVGGASGAAGAGEGFSALGHPASGLQDSDLEAEPDPPDWTQDVDEDTLRALSPQEKKRQEVINELFHTERTHVRNLKVLEQVFFRPMVENSVLGADEVQLLFANLEEMLLIHAGFNAQMKARRKESPVVYQLADLLLNMFDGPASENFQRAAASFCARQTIALEVLKERRRKDSRLNAFLTAAEGSQLCRRLQLKDIIPTAMQRLTKYPLLFENLAKYTSGSQEEVNGVQRAVERSKEILNHVNHAVRLAEDQQRLSDIQKKLDKSAFERAEHPIAAEFKNLDLTKHKLVHEGSLTWRIGNKAQKLIDLHVLLLEDFIILLQKQDDKFILKFYSHNAADRMLSPIIRVSTVLVRPNAVDNKALYLVNTSHNGAQIYDLVATSRADSKIWFRHISEAAEAYKAREGKGRRPEQPTPAASAAASATAAAAATAGAASSTAASAQPLPTPDADLPDAAAAQHHAKDKEAEDAGEGPAAPPSDADAAAAASPSPAPAGADAGPDAAHATPSPAAAATTPGASPSPDASAAADAAAAAKKLGGSLATPSPGLQRRLDSLRCTTEECPLVQPSEVVVSLRPVLTAEPVLTPIEKLRRKDALIREALAEKQQLVADLLSVPRDDFETIADLAGEPGAHKESSELVLAAVNQVNQLTSVVNEALKVTEEEAVSAASESVPKRLERLPSVPAHQLQSIASALNSHLTQLLKTVKTQDEERDSLRRELQRLREQVHAMHESRRRSQLEASSSASATATTASATTPLPNHEDDTGESTLAQKGDDDLDGNSSALDSHDDGTAEVSAQEFVDALSGEGDCPPEEDPPCSDPPAETPPSAEGTEDKIVDE